MLREKVKTFLVCFCVVVSLFIVLEGACRLVQHILEGQEQSAKYEKTDFMDLQKFQNEQFAVKDDLLGYRLVSNKSVEEYRFNNLGFRGKDFQEVKPKDTIRVICVGGSTTLGSNAKGDRFSYPWILEELLRRNFPGIKNFEVINAGVFGYHSWHSLLRVEKEFDRYDPDVFVFMDGLNDVMAAYTMDKASLKHLGEGLYGELLSRLVANKRESFVTRAVGLLQHSALYTSMQRAFFLLESKFESYDFFWKMAEKMELFGYKRNVEKAIAQVQARDKVALVLNYPWIVDGKLQGVDASNKLPYKLNPDHVKIYNFGRKYLPPVNEGIAREFGVPYIDPQNIFDEQAQAGDIKRTYSDNIHFTRFGNYILAKSVCLALSKTPAFTRLAGSAPALTGEELDAQFPELAQWRPAEPGKACVNKDIITWSGVCPQEDGLEVTGLDQTETDTLGDWRWAHGGQVTLRFKAQAGKQYRLEFALTNPIPGQAVKVLANSQEVYRAQDIPAQKWLVERAEGTCQLTAREGENKVELVFSTGNHQGYDFAPKDMRTLNAAITHLTLQTQ